MTTKVTLIQKLGTNEFVEKFKLSDNKQEYEYSWTNDPMLAWWVPFSSMEQAESTWYLFNKTKLNLSGFCKIILHEFVSPKPLQTLLECAKENEMLFRLILDYHKFPQEGFLLEDILKKDLESYIKDKIEIKTFKEIVPNIFECETASRYSGRTSFSKLENDGQLKVIKTSWWFH